MKRTKTIAGIVLATLMAGGGYAAWYKSDIEEAKRIVREGLNDPSSAKFASYEECGTASDGRVLKGKVNFRNEQGGMQGETTFIVRAYGVLPYAKVASAAHKYPNVADAFDDASIGLPIGTPCSSGGTTFGRSSCGSTGSIGVRAYGCECTECGKHADTRALISAVYEMGHHPRPCR